MVKGMDGKRSEGTPPNNRGGVRRPPIADERPERMWAERKAEAVLRVLRGENLEVVSRDLKIAVPDLARWRDDFVAAGTAGLRTRKADPIEGELKDAKAKIGDLMMRLELFEKKDELLASVRRSRNSLLR
jgi:hypothetical protein